ncbi:hypothetical protein NEUTE1DRAFT_68261 [Neurospora tetrasperma FGSC 2508]|uniref:PNPLA domain-containing protein n=1 Tax=Neurospora tetrasperma (strain FGSC 2508 / ATCC MYA-4615 / P0657) TaxID=510951 RepID=F8MVL1_NEUT8|nr:uncharacterized protein NEUTE1DRAFT_68261 [Neurospora tetrasperma FGSC 2508]EGO53963.1 hypothetical protein NEUTE1DRAFT_68261 [Neurospora tetrasperma FGSC 2508]EGZ68618.1 hypothetical protein NEUTE2DRAFT_118624 [Neurospora tetrasperma FGSC 2509]
MTEVLNPRRQQQPSSSSDSPSRERPRPPALKTSHSALRSINRPPNVRRISNRVSIAEPKPEPKPEETQLKAETITSSVPPNPATDNAAQPPPSNLAANPIAHTASTLKIAQTLHSSLSSRLQLHVTTTPWATRNILTLDGGGIKGYSSLILLRTLMQEIAALEQSLSPPAFCSADPTGNESYYFTASDDEEDRHFYSGVGTEMEMLDCEKRAGKLRDMHMRGKGKVKVGELKVDVPPETMRKGEYLPSHYFDYIAGTSVGGLIAIMLGVMGRTVEGCLEEFRNGEGRSRRDGRGLPVLFLEMEEDAAAAEEEEKVDVGDGGSQSQKREGSSSRAEGRRRRVISFPGLSGTFEIPLPGFHGGADTSREKDKRRTTWPTKKSRAWFDTFAKFSVTSTDLTGSGNNTAASRAIVSDSEDISPTTKRANTNNTVASSCSSTTTSSPTSSISFKKTSFQCQTLAWCSEIDSTTPTERHPYAFCTYEEVLVADMDGSDEEGKVPSIPEVAKAITTPSDSLQFKPFKLPAIGQFVDGSKEIRDPTLPVLKEISSLLGVDPSTPPSVPDTSNPPIDLLLSLGTDEHNAWFYEKLVHPFSSRSSPSEYSSSMSPSTTSSNSPSARGTSSPISSPSSSTTNTNSPALEELRQSKGHLYTHYHRFQVSPLSLSPFFSLPFSSLPFRRRHRTTNNHHLDEIEQATERWLSANNGEQRRLLKKYAEVLVRKRRARSATTRWETFALGVRYFCWVEGCERNPDTCKKGQGKGKGREGGRRRDGDGKEDGNDIKGEKGEERDEAEEGEGEGKGEGDRGFDTRGDFWDHLNGRHGLLSKKGAREVEDELDKGRRFGFE